MKTKRPKGIIVLSIFLLASSLLSIKHIINPDAQLIMVNHILTGLTVKFYYVITIGAGVAVALGLWFLKKWAALLFLFQNAVSALIIIVNFILIKKETFFSAGWEDPDKLVIGYRVYQVLALISLSIFTIWLLAYRRHFSTKTLTDAEQIK